MRTALALGVLSFHTFQIIGIEYPQLPWVTCFIAISGYLITDSMYRSASYAHFAWKRLLRIGPAFCLSLILVAITGGSVRNALIDWLGMSLYSGGSNPPLWSLSLEEALYFSLAVCFALGMYRTRQRAIHGLGAIYTTAIVVSPFFPDSAMPILSAALAFVSGSYLYMERDRAPWWPSLAAISLASVLWMRNTPFAGEMRYALWIGPPTAYFLLMVGLHVRPVFARYKELVGDPSLGIYVYHFPILLWLNSLHVKGGWLLFWTLALTIPLAVISWHAIEKRVLKMADMPLRFRPLPQPAE